MLNPRGDPPAPSSPAAWWPALVVFAVGCLAYVAAAGVFFLKDDLAMSVLTDAEGRPSFATLVHNFIWPATMTHDQFYRPLPILFAWFDLTMFGVDPAGFRVCNIGFHGLNAVLLALFFNQLTSFRRPAAGWFAGLLFALHPLHGEAVVWVTQRMVVQCATFSLLALIALESCFRKGSRTAIVACVLSSLAAALCKEVTVALPGAMVVLAFTRPAATSRERLRRTVTVALAGGALAVAILVTRRVIFGVWAGTYGNLSTEDYAKHFHVFERMPKSLLDGLWAVNSLEVPERARLAFGIAWLLFLALALWRLAAAAKDPEIRRGAIVLAAFAVTSFLPTLFIFQVQPMLTHGRFLYQPLLGLVGFLLVGFASKGGRKPLVAFAGPAALVVLFALAEQLNLRAYFGADVQIRTIRDGITREAKRAGGNPVVIAYDVPTEHHGVVTLDLSLSLAMRPPFTAPPGIDVFPLIAGQDPPWTSRLPELRRWLEERPGRPILHVQCMQDPVRLNALVGPPDAARGAAPELLAPMNGAILVHPADFPSFLFQRAPGAASYRLRLEADGKAFLLDLDPARNLRRAGLQLQWDVGGGSTRARVVDGSGQEQELPDLAKVWAENVFRPPLPVVWTVEALDGNGKVLGRSASRSFVMLTTNLPR